MIPSRKEAREEVQRKIKANLERGDWDLDPGDPKLFFVPSHLAAQMKKEVREIEETDDD